MKSSERYVLIVEDNNDLRHLYTTAASIGGFETREATNGHEALEFLRSQDSLPMAIVLDLMMPVMDGWEFLRHRETDSRIGDIPVLVCSAAPERIPTGISFLRKPVDVDTLIDALEKIARDLRASQEAAL